MDNGLRTYPPTSDIWVYNRLQVAVGSLGEHDPSKAGTSRVLHIMGHAAPIR